MMKHKITRRDFLKVAGGGCLVAATTGLGVPFIRPAQAAERLSVVDWGPPFIDHIKGVAKAWGKAQCTYTLHAGGAASILPKIKVAWPNPPYDVVDVWSPVFVSMINEGWAETVTLDDCPNLKYIPEKFISKDKNGKWKCIPRGTNGLFFISTEKCPIELTKIEDLLNPKLKGQILWPNPTLNTNCQVINLAMARGGDQFNMEPGWQFLKELAKSGNIGRVSANTSDTITSLSTGETSVTFAEAATGSATRKAGRKVYYYTKTHESMKTFMFVSGWVVLTSSRNKKLAFDFANFAINKENSELYHKATGELPLNREAQHRVEELRFSPAEIEKYVIIPDWDHITKNLDSWNKRFEKNIVRLL